MAISLIPALRLRQVDLCEFKAIKRDPISSKRLRREGRKEKGQRKDINCGKCLLILEVLYANVGMGIKNACEAAGFYHLSLRP